MSPNPVDPGEGSTGERLLLVDDDAALRGVLAAALAEEGFAVATAADGRAALAAAAAAPPDLVVLDVLMPELDGLEVCRRLRRTSAVPVIFLTSRTEEVDRLTAFGAGADDYLGKPFSTRELVARIRAVLRRSRGGAAGPGDAGVLRAGPLEVDLGRFEARWRGSAVALTRAELLTLAALVRRPGQVFTRERLIALVHGEEAVLTERTIDTFIKRIRQKLHAVDPACEVVETVVGVGYRLKDR